ncbi:MAG TPA: helix-turn-helix domain-containing protein [Candidatus Sulfotelmatobacter sp.]|nr:helix-turn-helix domain-containing protein [Candidatus Sulfotelmatobacter sp.]
MPTLGDVQLAVFPTALRLAPPGPARLDAPVAWVRVMKARTPAFDALEPGDLAIVPEAALELLRAEVEAGDALAARVRGAGACALLLLGPGEGSEPGPAAVGVAGEAGAMGLPVLRLAAGDAERLERAVIGYLVNARAELDRQAAALEADLERLALTGAGPDALAGAVATFVGRAVALEGAAGEVLAVHAPPRPPTASRAAARYLADPRAVALRAPLAGGTALVLLGPEPITELERTIARRVAALMALALGHVAPAARPRARRPEGFPAAGPPWVVLMARQGGLGEADTREAREALRGRVRRLVGARQLQLRGDADSLELRLVAAAPPDDPLALRLAERVAAVAGRPVAVSQPFGAPEARATAEAEARATLDAASALPPAGRPDRRIVRADRQAAYRLLSNLHNVPDGHTQAQRLLAPLLDGRPGSRARRLATLRAVLEQPGLAAAAAGLGIHRNTLAYRLRVLDRLTGWELDDPDLRLALLLALRLVQND